MVRSHRPFIEHVRIVIGSSKHQDRERNRVRRWEKQHQQENLEEQQKESVRRRSQTWACENDDAKQSDNHERMDLTFAQAFLYDKEEQQTLKITRDGRSSSMDVFHTSNDMDKPIQRTDNADSEVDVEQQVYDLNDDINDEDKNYHLLFVLDSFASAKTFVTDLHRRPCE